MALTRYERDRLFVAVAREQVGRDWLILGPDERRSPAAGLVAAIGVLDLDDPGPHVAQHHPAMGSGQGARQVDDDDVVDVPPRLRSGVT